ncbi:hypothetical protein M107_2181 [Bacteroides fragilis str. 3725 D9(v)]|uniref:Uncharacterized protein n=1 Tax=Bacteroides fragilis str. 3998T(B)3 TaxID=1339316 RepID=A0A015U6J5_BACFG|nr:hypothetical protein [Bacteroides fragilis]EXY90502.1 hypothetical protein M125_2825 [Bacteroides fragilis str. 3998T(B)3]EXY95379.1 hypothetical protein M081_2475 [Bacteroides fragilis str. 3998 T(B) 4]EXZ63829.1 hypothetical protein M107_2181 [Bacteroides fragilis str. 3725 D9(v)]MCS3267552.1 hypothetical protein [Bacteroides fragilis]MCS3321992.1 hypothetical protein [Bacteroides fragilis]
MITLKAGRQKGWEQKTASGISGSGQAKQGNCLSYPPVRSSSPGM